MLSSEQPQNEEAMEKLSPEETAAFELGLLSESTEVDYSFEECVEFARERRQAWKGQQPKAA